MLRLLYLAFLYWWYGGSLSSISEEISEDSSDQGSSDTSAFASAPERKSTWEENSTPPAPEDDSQLEDLTTTPTAAFLGDAEKGVQPSTEEERDGGSSDEGLRDKLQLKRASILDKVTPLTVLTSLVSDLNVVADWFFFKEVLETQSKFLVGFVLSFTVVGTIMYVLVALEFHPISKIQTWWAGKSLSSLDVPLAWQLAINVLLEHIPQLIITCTVSPSSVAGVLNITTTGVSLPSKLTEGYATQTDLPMSSLLGMVEEDPEVVRQTIVQRRYLKELAAKAAELAVLVIKCRKESDSKLQRAMAFHVMQLYPELLKGRLTFIRERLDSEELDLSECGLTGEQI